MEISYKKYVSVFFITAIIFVLAFALSNYFGNIKLQNIKNTQDKVSIDILSTETQFELLQESSCDSLSKSTTLSDDLSTLGAKLSYAENQQGIDADEVIALKKYYSLLEMKDYILMRKVYQKCAVRPITILYFYSNKDCDDCRRQGYVLTELRQEHPEVRIYTFDYNLDLNALKTITSIYKVKEPLPLIILNDKAYNGFQSLEDIAKAVPELATSTTKATSTKAASSTK